MTDDFLKDALAHTAKAAKERDITIDNQAESLRIMGSKDGLAQLSTILLDNAIKYSPAGATITIATKTKGNNALISVADQGQGIKAEDLPHIFDRLFRACSDFVAHRQLLGSYDPLLSMRSRLC
mgnify:CR=1 FL=1